MSEVHEIKGIDPLDDDGWTIPDPWPTDHHPLSIGERRMWRAYALVRDGGGRLSIAAVARRAGMSKTPIAYAGGAYGKLREVIVDEIMRRRPELDIADENEDEVRENRRQEKLSWLRKVAQQADSLNAELSAEIVALKTRNRRLEALLAKMLEAMRQGRLVPADSTSILLAELRTALGPPSKRGETLDDIQIE
ncbi:hypothetical protein K3177_14720 [Qipengyuania sp. GH25]|uniref:Uncharacterized protein n=1 Tax=Qipengyuania pacifica TaxID=2860199 RepID=A0ABS7JK41_9SPHN|nr:hypothetical protein [Qipengyuania aerophila]MBX7489759.1 hypothetical protein [Qipengyuania aerophila]